MRQPPWLTGFARHTTLASVARLTVLPSVGATGAAAQVLKANKLLNLDRYAKTVTLVRSIQPVLAKPITAPTISIATAQKLSSMRAIINSYPALPSAATGSARAVAQIVAGHSRAFAGTGMSAAVMATALAAAQGSLRGVSPLPATALAQITRGLASEQQRLLTLSQAVNTLAALAQTLPTGADLQWPVPDQTAAAPPSLRNLDADVVSRVDVSPGEPRFVHPTWIETLIFAAKGGFDEPAVTTQEKAYRIYLALLLVLYTVPSLWYSIETLDGGAEELARVVLTAAGLGAYRLGTGQRSAVLVARDAAFSLNKLVRHSDQEAPGGTR